MRRTWASHSTPCGPECHQFDCCLSNPPYGADWKTSQAAVWAKVQRARERSRFPGGLPPISDGQMLFLQHLATEKRPVHDDDGGGGGPRLC